MGESESIIRVEGLGKKYVIGHQRSNGGYVALRDVLAEKTRSLGRRLLGRSDGANSNGTSEEFWALKDVSFEVKRGEVVGIIGRNGAGKSTLLKILSQITEPTEGRIEIDGRVASLLEVGTGFHPELTGRENVYLNGAILGMTRAEIKRKFDEIVAFAEVEKFLDTPVKRYSSGMYMRLAFAVAAHLEPEVLIVDEVLAVGDAQFQKKCIGKMGEVAKGGRTVLFVSHNMAAIQQLCSISILLQQGRIQRLGPTSILLPEYQTEIGNKRREIASGYRLSSELILSSLQMNPNVFVSGSQTNVIARLTALVDLLVSHLCVLIYSPNGVRVAIADLRSQNGPYKIPGGHELTVEGAIPNMNLIEGEYSLGLYLEAGTTHGDFYDLASFEVIGGAIMRMLIPYDPVHRGFVDLAIKSIDFTCTNNKVEVCS